MSYPLYIVFGVLPSIIWLVLYLRKDLHPESKRMILKIFFWGMLIAIPAVFIEMGIFEAFGEFHLAQNLTSILNIFIGVAFIEEFLKFLVVKGQVLRHSEFDEPTDAMIYMIVAALGFAAIENILILFQLGPAFLWDKTLEISIFRFLGATFLHVLTSGLVGYFIALAINREQKKWSLIIAGLGISTLLHGLYNFSIMKTDGNLKLLIPVALLSLLAVFISYGFKRLKKIKSVCKI
ncbi:MAG: PrsW family intramembrane metalloprotease [Candidatus Wildermuthbacteria bacterium]|nr:PrsW family intramembrane metalloprotease [Candidatus Wildermuthbacteria bacterium]